MANSTAAVAAAAHLWALACFEPLNGGAAGDLEFNVLDRGERKKRGWQKSRGRNWWSSMVFVSRRLKPSALGYLNLTYSMFTEPKNTSKRRTTRRYGARSFSSSSFQFAQPDSIDRSGVPSES